MQCSVVPLNADPYPRQRTFVGENPWQGNAASIVKSAAGAQLLEPGQHDVPAMCIPEAVGGIQAVPQIQQMRPCNTPVLVCAHCFTALI